MAGNTAMGRWCGLVWLAVFAALPVAAQDEAGEPAAESAEAASEADASAWKLYGGVDYDAPRLSLSDEALIQRFGSADLDSTLLRLRGGVRFFDWVGVELQLGSGTGSAEAADEFDVAGYAGLFIVPTGVLFETLEIAGLLGITQLKAERGDVSESFTGQAYGVNLELPLRNLAESLPDLRLTSGYLVMNHNNRHRIHGAHVGLRYDFQF